ncbi:hypothetical protein EGM51_02360 [Verrucomicrobia bacterium S94]|nr:hypothetical protein EGM51_02360 [Verrucomicrobia bacterium S94]
MCFSLLNNECLTRSIGCAVGLLDVLVRQWSREQARAVAESLKGSTQTEIASAFGVGQSSINKSLQAAHWAEISSALGSIGSIAALVAENNHP